MKKAIIWTLLAAAVMACKPKEAEETIIEETIIEELPPIGFFADRYQSDTLTIKSGETFSVLMNRLGLGASDAYKLSELCDTVFDLRTLRAGHKLLAYYEVTDSTRQLEYVVYEKDRIRSTVFQCSDSLAIWNYDKPVEKQRKRADVTITSSLWNDMIAAGAPPALIMTLDDIYQWSVNFFTLQPDDKFQIIYTQSVCEGEIVAIDTVHFSLFTSNEGKQTAAVRYDTGDGSSNTYWDKGGESLKRMFLKAPLKYTRISSGFTYRRKHPITGKIKAHTAVDYAAPSGTPVYAIGDGTVTLCGWDSSGGGNRIRIKHMRGYESCYMHLKGFAKGIKSGSRVKQGELIGYVGSTGSSTGPHLDFRIWENGRPIDPLKLNSPASEPLASEHIERFNAIYEAYMNEINGD